MGVGQSQEEGSTVLEQNPNNLMSVNEEGVSTKPGLQDDMNLPSTQITQQHRLDERQVLNSASGYSYKVCDLNRLRRFIVLGSESNTYYSTPGQPSNINNDAQNCLDNLQCLNGLLKNNRHEEVLDIITEYSLSGRVVKEDPILTVLTVCAQSENIDIRRAALRKVVTICNIPTKLFKFIDLCQMKINAKRQKDPPDPQLYQNKNKRVEQNLGALKINENKRKLPSENTDNSMDPNIDTSMGPPKKKKVKKEKIIPEFKKVNITPKKSSGWGRMRRKAIAEFYVDEKKDAPRLLYLMTKYKQRHNWSHKSVLTYSHPKIVGENKSVKNLVIRYCTHGYENIRERCEELLSFSVIDQPTSQIIDYINILEKVSNLSPDNDEDREELVKILRTYGIRQKSFESTSASTFQDEPKEDKTGSRSSIQIVREHLPTGFLKFREVWEALLVDMPMTALIRNLGKMTSIGLFEKEENLNIAISSLTNPIKLKRARIHPMKVLIALQTYKKGQGDKGSLSWTVKDEILVALDKAFYLSFKQPELQETFRTNKKYMLCLDVSGSMTYGGCAGCETITPAMASAAMAWVTWNIEGDENVDVMAFGGNLMDMKTLNFNKDMLINDVVDKTMALHFGSTDCSLPMLHATQRRLEKDAFVVYTDSDTWAGKVHPVVALRDYNRIMNQSAKLIVCGMQSNGFTIADPQDPNMLDIVGFDPNVPELISEFSKGTLNEKCSGNCEDCR